MGTDWGAFTRTETKMTMRPQSHDDLVYPQQPQTHASASLPYLTGDFTAVVPEAPGLPGQQGHSCNGGHELRILAAAPADPWMPLALPGLETFILDSCLPACLPVYRPLTWAATLVSTSSCYPAVPSKFPSLPGPERK